VGGRANSARTNGAIARWHGNADSLAVAPYVVHKLGKWADQASVGELLSYFYGWTWFEAHTVSNVAEFTSNDGAKTQRRRITTKGMMVENYRIVTEEHGLPLSVYEVNHHHTGGPASVETKNKIAATIGGGLNVANWMLMMLENQRVRKQCFFSFAGDKGKVALWGGVVNFMQEPLRYRPNFLAVATINRVLQGDMVKVERSGEDPRWLIEHEYDRKAQHMGGGYGRGGWVSNPPFKMPYIHVYATRDEDVRGLILINLHPHGDLPVEINLPGSVTPEHVVRWRMSGPSPFAHNENLDAPQVTVQSSQPAELHDGARLELPAHSLTVFRWEQ
jgi:hypothetical protein